MSDGISDSRRPRSLDDIAETGAAWITERELSEIISDLRMFRASHFAKRRALETIADGEIDEGGNRRPHSESMQIAREALNN